MASPLRYRPAFAVETFHVSLISGLKLFTSNRLECLAEQLASAMAAPLRSPLAPEVIIVQSRGMARWASLQLAQLSGICMNCEFPFPKAFVERTLRQFFPEMALADDYSVGVMTWRIFHLLPGFAKRPEFALVNRYLAQDDGLKTFQLAEKVAHLFDQYLVYRPDMLMRWQRERDEQGWQAMLWRALVRGREPWHLAAIAELLVERMAVLPADSHLPGRISIFGLSSIPPLHLRVFFELSRHCEVNLFSLHPSREYFGHDLPPKLRARLLSQLESRGTAVSSDELLIGNPLLSSLGKLNRDLVEVRIELDEQAGFITNEQPERYIDAGDAAMLGMVQNDILHARNRGDSDVPKCHVSPDDSSIQIHGCHSPMREVEILYDQLLAMFEADPDLKPRDILVMTPDIEKYAPLIQAVFAYPEDARRAIPFSVADRRPGSNNPVIETLFALLDLPGSRCAASEIYSLLARAPISRQFGFTDDELSTIRAWIAEAGIRWGIDGKHRTSFQLPELEGNTWRAGLRRLLLGYAMAGGNRLTFEGILPHDEVEGNAAEVLGRFLAATDAIFEVATDLPKPRALSEWPEVLSELVERFFVSETSEDLSDLESIRAALDQLRRHSAVADENKKVEFCVIRHCLAQLIDQGEQRGGFLTGGVTFCALQPMRSIPAKVICLIGMDDQAFPRQAHPLGFDLMAQDRRCGDRSSRDDDRYVFLETLISARERLYLSYVGRSVIDNEVIPPSVLVSELLDYLDQACVFPEGASARDFLTHEHRLHAFSRHYFAETSSRLFSYSEANAAAARNIRASPGEPSPDFLHGVIPDPTDDFRAVELNTLVRFFAGPAKYFLRERIGIRLEEEDDSLEDSEPFALDSLERYHARQDLVARALDQEPADADEFAARGVLPLGEIGVSHFHDLRKDAEVFQQKVEPELAGHSPAEPWLIDLKIGAFNLTGRIEPIYGARMVHFRCSSLKPKDWLRAWISHLAKCAAHPDTAAESVLIGTDATVQFAPVPDAAELLTALLALYWLGLTFPLPFFPRTSEAYARAALFPSARSKQTPVQKAEVTWHGSTWTAGEKSDSYLQHCFAGSNPLDEEFERIALAVFEPILRNVSASA